MHISRNLSLGGRIPDGVWQWTIGIGMVVLLIVLGIAGFSLVSMLLTVMLVAVVIYFGSLGVLASSFVVGVLLKVMSGTLQELVNIWLAGPSSDKFFGWVNQTGYIAMVFLVFLLAYSLRFLTGSIRIFHFRNAVEVKNKTEE